MNKMNKRILKWLVALVFAVSALTGCFIYDHDRDDYYHHGYGHYYDRDEGHYHH